MEAQKIEALAAEILDYLIKHELWIDVRIYFNGKVWDSYNRVTGEYHYNDKDKIFEENAEPTDYFEYVGDILSMSFEGAFYDVLNGTSKRAWKLQQEFQELLSNYGLYYELGNAWNLTLYEE